ncbi:MAG TPA: hypothetical protein ACFYEK_15260 [Candidatus Wunengus sp. YC60]|uniref:hypothetical protein n=1 Tax=Candidatus Wunengus sp. YC60 TaxID=3367697 RepID=UPI0040268F7C
MKILKKVGNIFKNKTSGIILVIVGLFIPLALFPLTTPTLSGLALIISKDDTLQKKEFLQKKWAAWECMTNDPEFQALELNTKKKVLNVWYPLHVESDTEYQPYHPKYKTAIRRLFEERLEAISQASLRSLEKDELEITLLLKIFGEKGCAIFYKYILTLGITLTFTGIGIIVLNLRKGDV